jgi:hypothetical protein
MQKRFCATLIAIVLGGWLASAQTQQETVFRFAIGLPNGATPQLTIKEGDVGSVRIDEGTFSFKPTRENDVVRVEVLNGDADGAVLDVVRFTKESTTIKTGNSPSFQMTLLAFAVRKRGA